MVIDAIPIGLAGLAVLAGLAGLAGLVAYFVVAYDNGFSGFDAKPAPPRGPEKRAEGSLCTLSIPAVDGTRIEAWFFEPLTQPAPVVIMGPGLTGTKEGHLEAFAWRFVREGFAVLMIDFRCFGGSEGLPRHWVDPFRQREDYQAAIAYASRELASAGRIDPARIALWGSSFSGGCAIVVAAETPGIAAVVAQCPFLETSKELEPTALEMARYVPWTMLDLVRAGLNARFGLALAPVYFPAFGKPGEFAFAKSRENPARFDPAETGSPFWSTLPTVLRGGWENKVLARFLADFDKWKPMDRVGSLTCPIYLVAAEADDMVPRRFVEEVFARVTHDRREITVHGCGHYDLYVAPILAKNADLQADFLARHLDSRARRDERSAAS